MHFVFVLIVGLGIGLCAGLFIAGPDDIYKVRVVEMIQLLVSSTLAAGIAFFIRRNLDSEARERAALLSFVDSLIKSADSIEESRRNYMTSRTTEEFQTVVRLFSGLSISLGDLRSSFSSLSSSAQAQSNAAFSETQRKFLEFKKTVTGPSLKTIPDEGAVTWQRRAHADYCSLVTSLHKLKLAMCR
jgi:hypothetical protein